MRNIANPVIITIFAILLTAGVIFLVNASRAESRDMAYDLAATRLEGGEDKEQVLQDLEIQLAKNKPVSIGITLVDAFLGAETGSETSLEESGQ